MTMLTRVLFSSLAGGRLPMGTTFAAEAIIPCLHWKMQPTFPTSKRSLK